MGYPRAGLTATLWAPSGLTLAVLLLIDKRLWGRFAAVALCVDAAAEFLIYEFGIAAGLVVALGNVLEPLVGAALVRWWCGTPFRLRGVRDVLALALFAGVLSPMISATTGAATLKITGVEDFGPAWLLWWLGDSIGVLIVAPLVLAIIQGSGTTAALTPRRISEAIALLGVLVGSAHLFLTGQVPISFVMSPPLIWAALRFGIRGAALATCFRRCHEAHLRMGGVRAVRTPRVFTVLANCVRTARFSELQVCRLSCLRL